MPGGGWRGSLQLMCMLFAGCCCTSLGGTLAPGYFSPLPRTGGCCLREDGAQGAWGKPYAVILGGRRACSNVPES